MGNDFIMVLDFGGPNAQSMARKLRGQNYYCEVHSCSMDIDTLRKKAPRGLLLAGGFDHQAFDADILRMGIPVLALGNTSRDAAKSFGAVCEGALLSNRASQINFLPCPLFDGLNESDRYFERIDAMKLPEGFEPIATTVEGLMPAFADVDQNLYFLQFYPESNDPDGARILANFAGSICGCSPFWSPDFYVEHEIEYLRERIGDGQALMAISGGVDSTVCAVLMQRAIGNALRCVLVDTGLLRKGEVETVSHAFRESLGMELTVIDARDSVLNALKGVTDPQQKRSIIHDEFLHAVRLEAEAHPQTQYWVEGTIYPDLLQNMDAEPSEASPLENLTKIEPIRMLFKDEVRYVGETLNIPREILQRQPFPSPGLAIRCVGEVTYEKLFLLREADAIFRSEVVEAGLDRKLTQYFAILTDVHTVGIRDGQVSTEYACALRAINGSDESNISIAKLPYDLIERVVQQITGQVPGINHVLYDVTGKPSALSEWE